MSARPFVETSGMRERFFAKTKRDEASGCLVWVGARNRRGYGLFSIGKPGAPKLAFAHRVAFALVNNRWPNPCACHRCDNTSCVDVEHLFEGTYADNNKDMFAKGRDGAKKYWLARTHCTHGHELSGENVRRTNDAGHRVCRACAAEWQRKHRQLRAKQTVLLSDDDREALRDLIALMSVRELTSVDVRAKEVLERILRLKEECEAMKRRAA